MRTHDYSEPKWGHSVCLIGYYGNQIRLEGFGLGVAVSDYLILKNGPDDTTRYKVDEIRYMTDPPDQWFARLTFAPR